MLRSTMLCIALLLAATGALADTFFANGFEPRRQNLAISAAAFTASAEIGYPYHVYATIEAERFATDTVVNVVLVPFDPATDSIASINPLSAGFIDEESAVAVVGGVTIASLVPGQQLELDIESVLNPDYDNPDGPILPPGTYVPVVMFDALGETSHLDDEAFRADDFQVAGRPITVSASGRVAVLDIVRFAPEKPYFFDPDVAQPQGDPLDNGAPDAIVTHISAEFALQAYGASVDAPVDARFSVEIPSLAVPGTVERFAVVLDDPALGWPEMTDTLRFDVEEATGESFGVTEEMQSWPPPEVFTPALRAATVNLQLPESARDLLVAHGRDVQVLVRVDVGAPANASDVFTVTYLQQDPVSDGKAGGNFLVNQGIEQFFGASDPAGAGFSLGFSVSADPATLRTEAIGSGRAWVRIFGANVSLLDGRVAGSLDPADGANYASTVSALGNTISSIELSAGTYSREVDLTYSRSVEYTQRFNIGPVPASVTVGARATGGIVGGISAAPINLSLGVGPQITIAGYAKFSAINLGRFKAGIGADLLFLDLGNPFQANVAFILSGTRLQVDFSGPLVLRTLDGKVYAYATLKYFFGTKRWKKDIISWRGIGKTWNWFEPRTITL